MCSTVPGSASCQGAVRSRYTVSTRPRRRRAAKRECPRGKQAIQGRPDGSRGHKLVIVESPAKAKTIAGYLGSGYVVESSIGHIRDLPRDASDVPAADQGREVGAARRRRRQRVHALLRGQPRQEAPHDQAQGPAQGRLRALPRHGRGPRGRGHRVAPRAGAQAQGAGAPHGVPRDHQAGHRGGGRQPPHPRPRPRRGPGGPPHPRPALRLRGLARCCGRRSCRGCRPAASSPSPPASWSTGSGSGSPSASRRTGTSRAPSTPAATTPSGCSRPSCPRSTAPGWRAARTSTRRPT